MNKSDMSLQLTPLKSRPSLGDEVYEKILSLIIGLKLSPGGRISVDALVRELGVSQTPIRAALIRLQTQGLVVNTRNVGFSVAPLPSADMFVDIYEFRLLVEGEAAAKAAVSMTDKDGIEIEKIARQMEEKSRADRQFSYGQFALHDGEFHQWIAKKAGNRVVTEALGRLHIHMHLFRLRYHSAVTDRANQEHARIIAALINRDPAAAKKAMAAHISESRARMEPYFTV